MELILLRHGKTPGNREGRYIGRTDEPLSADGFAAARALGTCQTLSRVYVSPMLRAVQTAQVLFPNAAQVFVQAFREMDFGVFEGRNANEMENDAQYRAWVDGDCRGLCPEGEALDGFSERVCTAFAALIDRALDEKEKRVVIVSHGGTIMAIMDAFARPARPHYYDWHVGNLGGWRCRISARTWKKAPAIHEPVQWNDILSLEKEAQR